ncbi:lectin CPL-like [Salvia divinorum]|uniref:Lectin CPL-like n=1 Tax=Salvia divinorum TaxID=28513 RepID=A0ABD1I5I0_SALDI
MAKLLQTLIPLLSSIALLLATANTAQSQTTSFTYDFYGQKPTTLIYQGDAHFPPDSTYLRMTNTDSSGNPLKNRVGRAVYSKPVQFWEAGAQVDLETTVKFIIHPKIRDTDVPADGFTFFIQPVGSPVGSAGGSFGIFDDSGKNPSVFAVEFDIFTNPGVDPNYHHVGIDIGSNVSKNTTNVGNAFLGQEVTARIDYEEATKVISVHVSTNSQTFEVSYVYDLSSILPQQVEVGISASTGGEVAVHDLIAWYFTATLVRNNANRELETDNILQYV